MKLTVYTHVPHVLKDGKLYAYGPYVREMNLWISDLDTFTVVAPLSDAAIPNAVEIPYHFNSIRFIRLFDFNLKTWAARFRALYIIPINASIIFKAMLDKGHMHIRCPGNVGMIASLLQLLFPRKKKSFKYAGNWDPETMRPFTYELQRRLMKNSRITRNSIALVYGKWNDSTSNLLSFYTASYKESDKKTISIRKLDFNQPVRLLFVGTLSKGKNPIVAIEACRLLRNSGLDARLKICGIGLMNEELNTYILDKSLNDIVHLEGGVGAEKLIDYYCESHFLLLPSVSEGWPKAVAEAMWWGCLPVATPVSCVPQMLDSGNRGIVCAADPKTVSDAIFDLLKDSKKYTDMATEAQQWSRQFTLERMQKDIKNLILNR